jgi:TRAP-type C4-dicarboxylate transport system permease small subunit
MRNFVDRSDRFFDIYLKTSGFLLNWIALFMFCVMLGVNSYNIFIRSVFDRGTMWHHEISIMAAFWIYFAAYGLLSKEDGFIRVEFVVEQFPKRFQQWNPIMVRLVTITFHFSMLVLSISTYKMVSYFRTMYLEWPEYLMYIPLTVGAFDIVVTETIFLLRTLAYPDRPPVIAPPPPIAS